MLSRPTPPKLDTVAAYSQFLGSKVTVVYRVGDLLLSASGTFSADSGRSIFLEQHLVQRGIPKYFRWEIPYPYIHYIERESEVELGVGANPPVPQSSFAERAAAAGAGESGADETSVLPFPGRPETA